MYTSNESIWIKDKNYDIHKKCKKKEKCCMCGNEEVVFEVGSGQKAVLNETDYTKLIEEYYKKGEWLCRDCLFK